MEYQLGHQQSATLSLLAMQINNELQERLTDLDSVARKITPEIMKNPAQLQALLEDRIVLKKDFNVGAYVAGLDGTAIASIPSQVKRVGVNYMDRDHIAAALKEGRATVGKPVIGRVLHSPVFSMATPIRDGQGSIIGAISGVIDLGQRNFLDEVTRSRYGKSGYYLLEDPKNRIIITGTDRRRIMQTLPAPGINRLIDRHVQGFDETGITVNPLGVEVLASAKRIPVTGWFIVAALPTDEAFAPIHDMQRHIVIAAILMTLLSGGLTWWMLRRELSPMFDTVKKLAILSTADKHAELLPVSGENEIGELISGFNSLLKILGQREDALRESEFRWKFAIEGAGDGLWDWHVPSNYVFYSRTWKTMLGYSEDEVGNSLDDWEQRIYPEDKLAVLAKLSDHLNGKTSAYISENRLLCKSGEYKWVLDRGLVVSRDQSGNPVRVIGTLTDISERKKTENLLRENKAFVQGILDSLPSQIAVIDGNGMVVAVNESWCQFSKENGFDSTNPALNAGVGCNYLQICLNAADSPLSDAFTAHEGIRSVLLGRSHIFQMEYTCHTPNTKRWFTMTVNPLNTKQKGAVIVHTNITDRKITEENVRDMAYLDTLTKLPNRRLLIDRINQVIASSKRSNRYAALMFLDLDNFKPLNDMHGHVAGDLLLIEVASRLKASVREMDTVARIGGDEFVVMLAELDVDKAVSRSEAGLVAEKIRLSLAEPYFLEIKDDQNQHVTVEHHCSASIGVVLFLSDMASQDDIMKWADDAMYEVKDTGRNQVRFYDVNAS